MVESVDEQGEVTMPGEYNPYSPPKADLEMGVQQPLGQGELPSPWTRLGAALLDGLLYLAASLPAILGVGFRGMGTTLAEMGGANSLRVYGVLYGSGLFGMASAVLVIALMAFQVYLVSTRGQSLGKKWSNIRIVRLDNTNPGFGRAVVLRSWVNVILSRIPGLGGIYAIVDALFVFRADRRCIHDHIAGTKVVWATSPRTA